MSPYTGAVRISILATFSKPAGYTHNKSVFDSHCIFPTSCLGTISLIPADVRGLWKGGESVSVRHAGCTFPFRRDLSLPLRVKRKTPHRDPEMGLKESLRCTVFRNWVYVCTISSACGGGAECVGGGGGSLVLRFSVPPLPQEIFPFLALNVPRSLFGRKVGERLLFSPLPLIAVFVAPLSLCSELCLVLFNLSPI